MNETTRLQKLFSDLYDGNPWLDITLVGTLTNLNAQQAVYKPHADWNSIWEITNHLIAWRQNVLQRVNGQAIITPSDNYFSSVSDTSHAAWQQTLQKLTESQQMWITFLTQMADADLEKNYSSNDHSYADHIHGILQHDAYHLGQIVLLAKHAI